jgi:hypothetical protein
MTKPSRLRDRRLGGEDPVVTQERPYISWLAAELVLPQLA